MSTRSFSAFAILIILFSSTSLTQIKNRITIDEKTSKPILIALCDRNAFHDTSFSEWLNNEYDDYNIDTSTVNQITLSKLILLLYLAPGAATAESSCLAFSKF